jgi:hypothetical protein
MPKSQRNMKRGLFIWVSSSPVAIGIISGTLIIGLYTENRGEDASILP